MLSQPQSEPLLKKLPPQPLLLPPQQESKRIIQIMELHPHPLLEVVVVLHPHPVAVKSLIVSSLQKFCFMVYHMYDCLYVFPYFEKIIANIIRTICGQKTCINFEI